MKPDLSSVNTDGVSALEPEDVTFLQLAYIKKDDEIFVHAVKYTFRQNISSSFNSNFSRVTLGAGHQVAFNSGAIYSGIFRNPGRIYRCNNIQYNVITIEPYSAGMMYSEEPYSLNRYAVYYNNVLKIEDPLTDETWYNEMPHISCGPEKSGVIRMYGVVYPNRIAYREQSTAILSSITPKITFDEPSPWTNITSNVAEHPTYDLIAYSVNSTNNGGAKFRTRTFTIVGELALYEHYTVNEFVPGQNKLLIYYPQGKICFLNFVAPGSFSVSQGSCHPMIALHIRMVFDMTNSRFIAFRESTIAVYDYPTFDLKHTYAESPNYSDMQIGNRYQFHTYTNLYVRKFDTKTGTYVGAPIVSGNVEIAKINPHNDDYLFYMMDGMLKRKRISTGVVNTYDLKAKVVFAQTGIIDFSLRAFDIHKLSTNKLGALYCGLKSATPNQRLCIHIEYHYDVDQAFYYDLHPAIYTWRTLSIGTFVLDTGEDIWVTNGSCTSHKIYYDTTGVVAGNKMNKIWKSLYLCNIQNPIYYSSVLKNDLFTHGFEKARINCLNGDYTEYCLNNRGRSWLYTTNCFNQILYPLLKKDFYCGGSQILRMSNRADQYSHRIFSIQPTNKITGVVYKEWEGDNIYLYQNEYTKTVFNPESGIKCYTGTNNGIISKNYYCKDSIYCVNCDLNTGEYCIECRGGRVAYNGVCVTFCPGYTIGGIGGECFSPHCPYGYYKDGSAGSGKCVLGDCSSAGSGREWIFGDFCTICPSPMTKNGSYCNCPTHQIRAEDNTCIAHGGSSTKCPSPKKYMWHYGMCVDTVRNSTDYNLYGNDENIYCDHRAGRFVDFSDNKKCIDSCPSSKYQGNHPDYGLICVTSAECTSLTWRTSENPNVCEEGCPTAEYFNPDTGLCVTTCPTPTYNSPTGYTPKTCLDVCPGPSSSPSHTIQTWGIVDDVGGTRHCIDLATCKAGTNMNTYNATWVCINDSECNLIESNIVVQSWSDCRSACPTGSTPTFYLHDLKECLIKSECSAKVKYTKSNATSSICITDTQCISDATYFKDVSGLNCVTTCPLGEFKDIENQKCRTKTECTQQEKYTRADTNECLNEEECLKVDLAQRIIPATKSCNNGCTVAHKYLDTSSKKCYNKTDCVGLPAYTMETSVSGVPTCENPCPNPYYHNEALKQCEDTCPTGLFGTTSPPYNCLTEEQCWNLGENYWVIPSTSKCEGNCALYKNYGYRKCLVTCNSTTKNDESENECYSEFTIKYIKSNRKILDDGSNRVEIVLEYDMGYLDIKSELATELKVVQSNTEINISDFQFKNVSEFERRILTPITAHISQNLLYFTLQDSAEFNLEVKFNLDFAVWSVPSVDIPGSSYPINFPYPGKHYTITDKISVVVPQILKTENELNQPLNINSGLLAGLNSYKLSLNIMPIIHGLILTTDTTNLFTYMAQTFNKLLMYSFFSFFMDKKTDEFYLKIFHDLMDDVSEWLINMVKPDFVNDQDMAEVCARQSKRFCHVGVTNNIISSQMGPLVFLILILVSFGIITLLSKIVKRLNKMKIAFLVFTLPNYFIGNQLQLIFTVLNDILIPIWNNIIWILGYSVSVAFGIFFLAVICYLQFSKKRGYYVDQFIKKNLGEVFASQKLSVSYSRVQLFFDILMSLVLIIPSNYQRVQCGIWLLSEVVFCLITIHMTPFKDKKFMYRTNLINTLFVFLATSILVLIQTQESHQVTLSVVVTILSGFILAIDMLLSLYILLAELYKKFMKRKVKQKIRNKSQNNNKMLKRRKEKGKKTLLLNERANGRTFVEAAPKSRNLKLGMKKSQFIKRNQFRVKMNKKNSSSKAKINGVMLIKETLKVKKKKNKKYNSLSVSNGKERKKKFLKVGKNSKPTTQFESKQLNSFQELTLSNKKMNPLFESRKKNSGDTEDNLLSIPLPSIEPQLNPRSYRSKSNFSVKNNGSSLNKTLSKSPVRAFKNQNIEKTIEIPRKSKNDHNFESQKEDIFSQNEINFSEENISRISRKNTLTINLDDLDTPLRQKTSEMKPHGIFKERKIIRGRMTRHQQQKKQFGSMKKLRGVETQNYLSSARSIKRRLEVKKSREGLARRLKKLKKSGSSGNLNFENELEQIKGKLK